MTDVLIHEIKRIDIQDKEFIESNDKKDKTKNFFVKEIMLTSEDNEKTYIKIFSEKHLVFQISPKKIYH